jgi:hypothetical protein
MMAAVFVTNRPAGGALWQRLAQAAVALGLAVAVVVQLHAVWPITGTFARKDPTFQLRGWPEIGQELTALAEKEGAGFVATTSYGLNGQLDFLLKDDLPVFQLTERIRYVMQPEADLSLFDGPGLYVAEKRRNRESDRRRSFANVEEVAELTRKVKDVPLEKLVVYKVDGRIGPVFEPVDSK